MEVFQETEQCAESSRNTVVVSGVPTDVLPADRMTDKLINHFQNRRKSDGGDVKFVRFPTNTNGVAFITFMDGAGEKSACFVVNTGSVISKHRTPLKKDVFSYVSNATLDLSMFDVDLEVFLGRLRSRHRSLRFTPLSGQKRALIEGPFTAAKALREELICMAARLQKYDSHHAAVEEGVCEDDAEQREADRTETSLGHVCDVARFEEGGRARDTVDAFRHCKKKMLQRQVVGEESDLTPPPASDPPAPPQEGAEPHSQRQEGAVSHSQRQEGQEGAELRSQRQEGAEPHSQVQEVLDLSVTENLQDVSVSPWSDLIGPEEMWVDLMTFQYIDTFQRTALNECLGHVLMSHECFEENDLVRVSLSEAPPPQGCSAVHEASENLQRLFDAWQHTLTVHEVQAEPHDHEKLSKICINAASLYKDVLYTIRGSKVKIIGPSTSSYLFYISVMDKVTDYLLPPGGANDH
uniref:RRM domain-containing protein n=1 Tax=Gouania willdenowi TaxID=441366 RepID=A0A8C5DTD1_GOUWI